MFPRLESKGDGRGDCVVVGEAVASVDVVEAVDCDGEIVSVGLPGVVLVAGMLEGRTAEGRPDGVVSCRLSRIRGVGGSLRSTSNSPLLASLRNTDRSPSVRLPAFDAVTLPQKKRTSQNETNRNWDVDIRNARIDRRDL